MGNGKVRVDGKEMWIDDLQRYRQGSSTRQRSRTRGGSIVRTKASWLVVEYIHSILVWLLCVYFCVIGWW